jgi:hypothetical protein
VVSERSEQRDAQEKKPKCVCSVTQTSKNIWHCSTLLVHHSLQRMGTHDCGVWPTMHVAHAKGNALVEARQARLFVCAREVKEPRLLETRKKKKRAQSQLNSKEKHVTKQQHWSQHCNMAKHRNIVEKSVTHATADCGCVAVQPRQRARQLSFDSSDPSLQV